VVIKVSSKRLQSGYGAAIQLKGMKNALPNLDQQAVEPQTVLFFFVNTKLKKVLGMLNFATATIIQQNNFKSEFLKALKSIGHWNIPITKW
jgi:hypothetical protein